MAARLDDALARFGIPVRRERAVSLKRPGMGPRILVKTDRLELVGARLVLVAAGIEPVSMLGGEAIRRTATGTYLVDGSMRTSARNVFACGDCVSVPALPDERPRWLPLSPVAFRGARVAGYNAARQGRAPVRSMPPPAGAFTARVADMEVASVGLTLDAARSPGHRCRLPRTMPAGWAGTRKRRSPRPPAGFPPCPERFPAGGARRHPARRDASR